MIVVDTSVWIKALRDAHSIEARALGSLLDEDRVLLPVVVRLEIVGGASKSDQPRLRRVLSALPMLYPGEPTWTRIEEWIGRAAESGVRFGVTDLIVASLAADWDASIWTLDRDFDQMAQLGFMTCHRDG